MSGVSVKPTLSPPSATLARVALDCPLTPAQVLQLLAEREPLPFALTGNWSHPPDAPVGAIVGGDPGWSTGAVADEPPTAEQVWDRLHLATAALQCRELLARRALLWAYGCAGWFAVWCVVVTVFRR